MYTKNTPIFVVCVEKRLCAHPVAAFYGTYVKLVMLIGIKDKSHDTTKL